MVTRKTWTDTFDERYIDQVQSEPTHKSHKRQPKQQDQINFHIKISDIIIKTTRATQKYYCPTRESEMELDNRDLPMEENPLQNKTF